MSEALYQIQAPHFTAGLYLYDDRVRGAAPIIKYMKGWTVPEVMRYCREKGWYVVEIR